MGYLMAMMQPRRVLGVESLEVRAVPAMVGQLDPSFGTGGLTIQDLGGVEGANALVRQDDGKVLVAGTTTANGDADILVARYNPNGALDTSFGVDGFAVINRSAQDSAFAITIQPSDGRIVIAAQIQGLGGDSDVAIIRLTPDGFDSDQRLEIGSATLADSPTGVAVLSNGTIAVAYNTGSVTGRVERFDANLIPIAGGLNAWGATRINAMTAVPAGSNQDDIVVAGTVAGNVWAARVPAGGGSPIQFFQDMGGTDAAQAVTYDYDPFNDVDRVVLAGSVAAGGGQNMLAMRLDLVTMTLDASFNPSGAPAGTLQVNLGGNEEATGVATLIAGEQTGRVVLTGHRMSGGNTDQAVVWINPDGALASELNGTGSFVVPDGGRNVVARGMFVDPNGRIVIAGVSNFNIFTGTGDVSLTRVIGDVEAGLALLTSGPLDGTIQVHGAEFGYAGAPIPLPIFPGFPGTVRTALGDVNGDGADDLIAVTGPGGPIRVTVLSGRDASVLVAPFDPFGGDFTGGGFVTAADFDRDGRAEFVVTPDQGGGPRISIFSQQSGVVVTRANFITIEANFRGGCRPAAGDINGDGVPDLAVSAGFLGGPRIVVLDGTKLLSVRDFTADSDKLVGDFFAYSDLLRNGAYVAVGDVDGDGFGDLVFGAGPGGGPEIRIASGRQLLTAGSTIALGDPIADFFLAGDLTNRGGVRVALKDADADGRADVAAADGAGGDTRIRVYRGRDINAVTEPASFQDVDPYAGLFLFDGVYVG